MSQRTCQLSRILCSQLFEPFIPPHARDAVAVWSLKTQTPQQKPDREGGRRSHSIDKKEDESKAYSHPPSYVSLTPSLTVGLLLLTYFATTAMRRRLAKASISSRSKMSVLPAVMQRQVAPASAIVSTVGTPTTGTSNRIS